MESHLKWLCIITKPQVFMYNLQLIHNIKGLQSLTDQLYYLQQGKSEGFDSCDRPSNLAQIWSKSSIFCPLWPWNLMDDLGKQ